MSLLYLRFIKLVQSALELRVAAYFQKLNVRVSSNTRRRFLHRDARYKLYNSIDNATRRIHEEPSTLPATL